MSQWTKGDGARIQITFDQPLITVALGAEASFTVTAPEYTYVPGGELVDITKTVERVENKAGITVDLDLAAGELTGLSVACGTLRLAVDHG